MAEQGAIVAKPENVFTGFKVKPLKVLLVSCFGRGHWLAVELVRSGLEVVLLDVSEQMKSWVPEDIEGPFGFFAPENRFSSTLVERMLEDDASVVVPNSWAFWPPSGPVELKGPVAAHRLQQFGISSELRPISDKRSFQQSWLWHLFHQVHSSLEARNVESLQWGYLPPLRLPLSLRQASRVGHQRSLDWCERSGVKVYRAVGVKDLVWQSRAELRGLEILPQGSQSAEIVQADQFIWSLSSEETGVVDGKLQSALFPKGPLEPTWIWQRFRVRLEACTERAQLPALVMLTDDPGMAWVHENFLVLRRTASNELWDAWIRLPNEQRFNREYLDYRANLLLQTLRRRMSAAEPTLHNPPEGYSSTYNQVGPARHPIYSPSDKQEWRGPLRLKNWHMDGPELWPCLGWEGMWVHQDQLANRIKAWMKLTLEDQRRKAKGASNVAN